MQRDSTRYLSNDTIAAVSSGLGGAIGLIRISGPDALPVAMTLTHREQEPTVRRVYRVQCFSADSTVLDEGLLTFFKGPKSFTGEDVVELALHGSSYTLSSVLKRLFELGARAAERGEFSFRAVRNGKLTLPQAQGIADLIASKSGSAASLALDRMYGVQNRFVAEIQERLERTLMMSEVAIDFSDQDLEELSLGKMRIMVRGVMVELKNLLKSLNRGQRIREGISVALVGAPNVGKSSLFNALLGEDRSIVTDIAGTTRDIVGETFTLEDSRGSWLFKIQDTAGVRDTEDAVELKGVERSLKAAREADIVLLCVDGRENSEQLKKWKKELEGVNALLLVGTKRDLKHSDEATDLVSRLSREGFSEELCWSSAHLSDGLEALVGQLLGLAERLAHRSQSEWVLTGAEQRKAVEEAVSLLSEVEQIEEMDLFAATVRQALNALEPLLGKSVPDDILGKIFAQFCIGK